MAGTDDARARVIRFFDEQVPAVVAGRGDLFDQTRGTISVLIEGAGGWTVTFGDHASESAVTPTPTLDADLVLVWALDAFASLLDGPTPDAAASRPVAMGDLKLLERFGSLLLPPARGGVGARLWNV